MSVSSKNVADVALYGLKGRITHVKSICTINGLVQQIFKRTKFALSMKIPRSPYPNRGHWQSLLSPMHGKPADNSIQLLYTNSYIAYAPEHNEVHLTDTNRCMLEVPLRNPPRQTSFSAHLSSVIKDFNFCNFDCQNPHIYNI